MADWNDVLTVLNNDTSVRSWNLIPDTNRIALLTYTTENNNDITMVVDNGSNEYWLQIISSLFDNPDDGLWKAAAWHLRYTPTIGLAQIGDSDTIAIRHGILLPTPTSTRSPTAST
ncbi:hypothetical protein NHF46_11690 [Arthrobacter alpinus]|nr:hypothetical protein [Arthrobacter alpinus]